MALNSKVKYIYDTLKNGGGNVGSEQEFNDWFFAKGKEGYHNRKYVYETLTKGGGDAGKSYEEFRDWLGLHAVKPQAQVKPQQPSATQQPQVRKAQAKPQTATPTAPTQGGFTMPEGFGEADFSRGVQSPFLQEQERKAHAHDKQLAKQGLLGRTEQQKREASAKAQAKTVQKAIQGDEDAVAETGLDSATQQLRDRMDYYNATGKELKDDVLDLTSIGIAPTVARDENGEIMTNEDGTVIKGQVSDPVRAATQAMDSERMRVADLDRQIEEANDELLNLKKEIDKIETPGYVYSQDALSPYADPRTTNTDLASLSVAYTQLQEKLKGLQVERAGGQKGFFNGMLTAAKDPSTWLLGLDKLSDTAEMLRVSEKVKSGKELTDSEKKMLDATMANNAVQGKLSEDSDWLYRAGAMTTQMLPFALQIGFTGGFGSVAEMGATGGEKLAARYAAKYGEEALINRVNANIIRGLGVTFGDVAAGFCNAVTTGAANTAVDAMERRIGDLGINEKGEYQFTGDDDWIRAIGKAIVSQTKEFATERFGEHLPSLREMNVWFAKQGMGARKIARALSGFAGTKAMQNTAAFLRKGGINGVGGEILEEEIGLPIDVAIGDMTWEDALSGKTQWDICGGMLLSMGAMHATGLAAQGIGKTYNTAQYYKYKNRADKSAHKAATMMGNDAWRAMQEKIDGTETQNMETVWEDIRNNESLSDKEKRAAFDYMNALTLMRGYNMGMFFSASEAAKNPALMAEVKPTTKKEQDEIDVMQSRDRGYNLETPQEQNDAKNMRDYARQQLEGHVSGELISRIDEDPLGTLEIIDNSDLSDEAKQKARDYVNAKATYDGMIQSVRDRIETETQQATEEIDSRVASEEQGGDGKIHPATMKADDRQVYIVSGNVRMLDDGSMVDRENSDKDLIVRDAETGKVEFVSIDDILRTDEVEDAEQLKQEAVQNIQEAVATEASNAIDGVLSFEPNSNFTIMSDDGAEHTVQVVQDQGDGTVAVLIDGATDAVPMAKEQLQEMSEAYNMSRLQQYEAEKAVERAEETQEQSETAEGAEEVAEGAEGTQAQETPAQEEEPMPMIGEGEDAEPDFASVTPERAHKYVYEESGLDEQTADEFVGNNLKAAQKELDKAKSKTPKMGTSISQYNKAKQEYDANVQAAQQRVDYWNQLKSEHDNTIAQRNAERAAERKAIEEREKAKAEAEEAARQAEITARQEEEQARGANTVGEQVKQKWNDAPKVEGSETEITLQNGERVKGRYMLVESGAATASHDARNGFARSEGFPVDESGQTVNDRDYERDKDAQSVTRSMGEAYDSRAIQDVPVVSRDGVVLSGNGRTMAGEIAAQNGTDGAYTEHLRNYGSQYGFTKEQVDGMQHPRLVFVPEGDMPYTTETFAKFNEQAMKSQSKTEKAVKMGKVVDDATYNNLVSMVSGFDSLSDFYNSPKGGAQAVNALQQAGVVNEKQMAELYDGEKLSEAGRALLESVLIGKAFEGNADMVRMLSEFPSLRRSVVQALTEIGRNKQLGNDYNVADELAEAVKLAYNARKQGYTQGQSVSAFARQLNLFPFDEGSETVADYTNATILMLADALNDNRETLLRNSLALYNDAANDAAAGQLDIFGGGVRSKETIIKDVLNFLNNGERKEQQAALNDVAERRKANATSGAGSTEENGTDGASDEAGEASERSNDGREGKENTTERQGNLGETRTEVNVSDTEFDEDGSPFVLSSKGNTVFGEIREETNLTPAPIKLSLGNSKYGRVHLEKRHGEQIRNAGFSSVEEFVEFVATNYKRIRVGENSAGEPNGTYLLQLEDDHNNTLYIELSTDNSYWSVNSGGVFRRNYGNNKEEVWSASEEQNKQSAADNTLQATDKSDNPVTSNGNVSNTSASKVTNNSATVQENEQKNEKLFDFDEIEALKDAPRYVRTAIWDYATKAYNDALAKVNPFQFGIPEEKQERMTFEKFRDEFKEVAGTFARGTDDYLPAVYEYMSKRLDIKAQEKIKQDKAIQIAEQETNTNPTEAQKEAGNYKKGHVKIDGFDITIENPKGSERSGTDASGKKWSITMQNTYGYIRGTEGVDGDHIDVFLSDDPSQGNVFVIDQVNKDGSFDEHKVMYGFPDAESARKAYLSNYEEGWQGLGAITPVSKEEFKKWINSSHRKTKPFAEYSSVKPLEENKKVTDTKEKDAETRKRINEFRKKYPDNLVFPVRHADGSATYYDNDARVVAELLGLELDGTKLTVDKEQFDKSLQKLIATGRRVGMLKSDNATVELSSEQAEQKKKQKKATSKDKIEDVGERLEGARKDALKVISKSFADATEKALTELPFSKAFKKPDLKKAVENGALREEDAQFYEAYFATMVDSTKPKVTQRDVRWKKYDPNYETSLDKWVKRTFEALTVLKGFVEATPEERDEIMRTMLEDHYPTREEELAHIEQLKAWNPDRTYTDEDGKEQTQKHEWGDKTSPNPLWVTSEILSGLGYKVGDKVDIPYGVVKANTSGTGYTLENLKGERNYYTGPFSTVEEAIEGAIYLAKLKRGDTDLQHPRSSFSVKHTNTTYKDSGRYRVIYGSKMAVKEFDSKEEADKFVKEKEARAISAYASPIQEVDERTDYVVTFRNPLTGESKQLDIEKMATKAEAMSYLYGNIEELNEKANALLQSQSDAKGKKKEITADDMMYAALVYANGKVGYSVMINTDISKDALGFPHVVREGFATRKEALDFIEEHKAEVYDAYKKHVEAKKSYTYFSSGADTRAGEDYRGGKDVTAEDFMNEFGFRGVQFGNWTNQADRQMAINQAYDALIDLARLLGVSPRAISLNGKLGIAFGSRGSGNANAHFEPGEFVINLTKTRGAGSLAHEWWHALDNYFAKNAGMAQGYVTETTSLEMRQQLREAFNHLLDVVRDSYYYERSKKQGAYWGSIIEVTARLFAEWADRELKKKGDLNTFLTRGADFEKWQEITYETHKYISKVQGEEPMTLDEWKRTKDSLKGLPYPSEQEVNDLGDAVRNIFDTVQERIDEETGNVALFHKASEEASEVSEQEGALRDALVETMRNAGIEVSVDEKEGQRVLDMVNGENATMSKAQKRAAETVSVASNEEHHQTVVSTTDGAKVLNNLDNLATNLESLTQNPVKTFLGEVAKALEATKHGSNSQYATFETKNGKIVTIRLANHNAKVSTFDNHGEDEGISIVVSPKNNTGTILDGNAHIVEYYYNVMKLRRAEGKPLADIVRAIKQSLYSGEFNDPTGIAERQEVNDEQIRLHKVKFFRTADGKAYGFVKDGKMYIDPSIATSETPIHEYTHLWAEALRKGNPEKWEEIKRVLLNDESVKPFIDKVRREYPELTNEDDLLDEVLAQYSGKRGSERLRAEAQRIADSKDGAFEKADVFRAMNKLKDAIRRFWQAFADFMHVPYRNADEIADRVMYDLLSGVNPKAEAEKMQQNPHKARQLEIVTKENPMRDDYHIGIRSIDDIKTYEEAVNEGEGMGMYPDFTEEDARKALESGEVTVYSSYPIENGVFVSTSRMEAEDYAGGGKVYSKRVPLSNVAWLYANEGQYAEVDDEGSEMFRDEEDNAALEENNNEQVEEDDSVLMRDVDDEELIEQLEREPKVKVYRSMVLIDGKLYPPMSSKSNRKLRQPSELGKWEEAEEAPEKAKQGKNGKWYFSLKKDNGKSVDNVAYNPYIHTSTTMLNDQFMEAQSRDNLVVVEMEVPVSELTSGYRAEKAHDTTGVKQWKAGPIQGQLTGTREVILTRWAKPIRIVPTEEVAQSIAEQIDGQVRVMPSNVVTPQVREALEALGVQFVETDNKGKLTEGVNVGKTWVSVYGNKKTKKKGRTMQREGDGRVLSMSQDKNYSRKQRWELMQREWKRMQNKAKEYIDILKLDRIAVYGTVEDMPEGMRNSLSERKKKAKGWYDTKTGKIVIILGNHRNAEDVAKTILHEAVAHYGLRKLFGKNFDTFLDNVYQNADVDVKMRIADMAARQRAKDSAANRARRTNEDYLRIGTEEYLAKLAEDMDFENRRESFWSKIKSLFIQMLESIGLKDYEAGELSDNELRYILWRSYKNLSSPGEYRNVFDVAEDVVMQENLGVGNYVESQGETMTEQMQAAEQGMVGEEAVNGTALYEALNRKYNGKDYNIVDLQSITDEELFTLLGGTEKDREGMSEEDFHEEMKELKEYLKNNIAEYNRKTKKMLIFANEISKDNAEEIYFHENIHAILDEWYGDTLRGIAERFWEIAPDDGKVSKDYIKRHYPEEKQKEELFTYWLARSMRDGDVDAMVSMFDDAGDVARINTILNTFGYVKGRETNERRRPGNPDRVQGTQGEVGKEVAEKSDINEDDELFRDAEERDRVTARDMYERMVSSGRYQFQEAVQDSMLGLKALYKAVLGKNTNMEDVPGNENAYMAENLMSSATAAEQSEYFVRYMKPLIETIHKLCGSNKKAREELTNYLMAKHGLERNRILAERDFKDYQTKHPTGTKTLADFRKRDYAGLTALTEYINVSDAEAEAQRMVDAYEQAHDVTELWQNIKAANEATLTKLWLSGVLSRERYDQIRDMFEYYIPLQGFDEKTSDEVYGYLTSKNGPLMGSPIKRAKGRSSKADDPIATMGLMADKAIQQGNRNRMKICFLNFVLNHPSDLVSVNRLWLKYDDVTDEWVPMFADISPEDTAEEVEQKVEQFEQKMQALAQADPDHYKHGREVKNIPYRVVSGNLREHQVLVKRGGETYVLTINGNPRAAQALNGLTNPDVEQNGVIGKLLSGAEYINRQLSAFYTTRNPDFVASNFLRDMIYSNCMSWAKEGANYGIRFNKNFAIYNPLRMAQLYRKWENGTLNMGNKTESLFYEFMRNGGETGYTNVRDLEAHKRSIAQELKRQGNTLRAQWHALGELFDLVNRSVENTARFAAFVTSKELGRTTSRAVYDAKEISVNFNKKGSGSKMLGAQGQTLLGNIGAYISGIGRLAYVFWNAGVQGTTNLGKAIKRRPKSTLTGLASMFVLGYIIPTAADILAGGGGDDDDDDKNDTDYWDLPEYVRRSNICFKVSEDNWIKIPLPIEFRAMYGLGEITAGTIRGRERYSNSELAFHLGSQVSQVLPLDVLEGGGGLHPFIPSVIKPLAETAGNRSWTGMPIYRDSPFNENDPEWTKVYSNTNKTLVSAAEWLNEISGGDKYKKGAIDINPAQVEYMLNGYFGGVSSTINKLANTGEMIIGERDFDWRNVPIANRVLTRGDERTEQRKIRNDYFKYKERCEETKRLLKKYEAEADNGVFEYAERLDFLNNSKDYGLYEIYDEIQPKIKSVRKDMEDATDEERKELEKEERALQKEMVLKMRALEDAK